jgi:histidinol-phosphatase
MMKTFLDTALAAARISAEVIKGYYLQNFEVEVKSDQTPVTVADREAERVIRKLLLETYPDHGFYGEESGQANLDSEYLWLVDPIDGTKSFVAGYGMFSTQIALMHQGELVLGVSSAPAHDELAWATKGGGAFLDGKPIKMRHIENLSEASLSTGNIQSLASSSRWSGLGDILAQVNRTRGYGDYYHYHRLAAGQLDAVIESDVNILDIAALVVIAREAGGVFTDLEGNPPGLDTTSVVAATAPIHAKLMKHLN